MTAKERFESIKNYPGCRYHLTLTHSTQECKNKTCCKYCQKSHNSLLHFPSRNNQVNSQANDDITPVVSQNPPEKSPLVTTHAWQDNSDVLLGTAIVHLQDNKSMFKPIRILLDSGSQCTLITQSCAHAVHLQVERGKINLSGVGQQLTEGTGTTHCILKPRNSHGPLLSTEATVVPNITGKLPTSHVPRSLQQKIASYVLADPNFFDPREIDILLGADLFWKILRNGVRRIEGEEATLMNTVFGWVVLGRIHNVEPSYTTSLHILTTPTIDNLIEKFWALEEPASPKIPSNPEDVACETHFDQTHYRLPSGRYGVRLPFKGTPPDMRDGQQQALKRFFSLESKLSKDQDLKNSYSLFMEEYRQLGHMRPTNDHAKYIIPHHGVVKRDSSFTKLRVVFDASMRCKFGSLNDFLYAGPKLQLDIADIILNFRTHEIAFTADICKMYRQIELHKNDRCYQHIFWRSASNEELKEFELTTVTYGISVSPFLALRVIKQLTMDEGRCFPEAVQALSQDMYVDDIVTGSDSLEGALILQKQLIDILEKGGFQLRKWASNSQALLNVIPEEHREQAVKLNPKDDFSIKILGMHWDPSNDMFSYHIHDLPTVTTKRSILSTIARIYDPLGYLSPVVFYAKVIMQDLWKHGLNWDDPIPTDLNIKWSTFIQELRSISSIQIPRSLRLKTAVNIQLIGFCDASQQGYAAMLFLRVEHPNGEVHVSLLKAKTKLAPIKTITIPRLELCGAHLLALLYDSIKDFLRRFNVADIYMFTDSTIVLGWLNTLPHKLNIYVANRILQILEKTERTYWFHVDSSDNPADGASRGMTPTNFLNYPLWWTGPKWLFLPTTEWPKPAYITTNVVLPEIKLEKNILLTSNVQASTSCWCIWLERFSSLAKLLRVVAYLFRFIHNIKTSNSQTIGALTVPEIQSAEVTIIRWTQQQYFPKHYVEPALLSNEKELVRLSPFLDGDGLLRVGGRLRHSDLHYDSKHPVLLPQKCHLSNILVDHYHRITFHGGLQMIQSALRQKYWILSSRRLIKSRILKCLKCFKLKAKPSPPLMGDLPPARFTSGRAFLNVGVDYAGPFQLKFSSRRNPPTSKGYICLFICLATRALHLEIVSSLTTDAFLASLDRFTSRRGKPINIYSDCGTNFVGAAREMKEISEWFGMPANQLAIANHLVEKEITWHFNPPAAPHFGGIWEAGVKSVKHHLTRTLSSTPYTFEEFYTLVAQIEAILNSRPLYPLSSEPEDFQYLTPGHFLIGDCLTSRPTHDWTQVAENRLSRWQLIQQRTQHFWTKWRHDYLNTLQQRIKWTKQAPYSPQIGDLVLIHDKTAPPLSWPTARITALHKGADDVVRVVTIKTINREFQRPVVNLIPLLNSENDEQL